MTESQHFELDSQILRALPALLMLPHGGLWASRAVRLSTPAGWNQLLEGQEYAEKPLDRLKPSALRRQRPEPGLQLLHHGDMALGIRGEQRAARSIPGDLLQPSWFMACPSFQTASTSSHRLPGVMPAGRIGGHLILHCDLPVSKSAPLPVRTPGCFCSILPRQRAGPSFGIACSHF